MVFVRENAMEKGWFRRIPISVNPHMDLFRRSIPTVWYWSSPLKLWKREAFFIPTFGQRLWNTSSLPPCAGMREIGAPSTSCLVKLTGDWRCFKAMRHFWAFQWRSVQRSCYSRAFWRIKFDGKNIEWVSEWFPIFVFPCFCSMYFFPMFFSMCQCVSIQLWSPQPSTRVPHHDETRWLVVWPPALWLRDGVAAVAAVAAVAVSWCPKSMEVDWNLSISSWGLPQKVDGLLHGKSQSKMDDFWEYPHFRKPALKAECWWPRLWTCSTMRLMAALERRHGSSNTLCVFLLALLSMRSVTFFTSILELLRIDLDDSSKCKLQKKSEAVSPRLHRHHWQVWPCKCFECWYHVEVRI